MNDIQEFTGLIVSKEHYAELKASILSAQKKIEAQGLAIEKLKEQRNQYMKISGCHECLIGDAAEIEAILNTQEGL